MEPDLAQFESDSKTRINIININVDSEQAKLDKYPAVAESLKREGSIPNTWVVDAQGKIVWSQVGGMTRAELETALKPYL